LNDQAFFDINIDSEIEESTESSTPSSQPNLDLNNNNNSNNDRHQSLDRKSIFKFSKNSPKLSSQANDPLETPSPIGFLTPESKKQNGLILTPTKVTTTTATPTNNSKQQLNLQTALKKFSPINKTPPPNNLTISQAADLLLNEIGMACYSDDDEDDDDDEDEEIDLDETKKTLGPNRVNSHCKKNLNQSESMNSFDNFLNSSTISSLGNNLLENNLADISVVKREEEGEEDEGQNDEGLFEENKCVIDSNKTLLKLDDSNDFNNKTPIGTDNDETSKTIDENKCKINENKTQNNVNGTKSNTTTKQNLVKSQSLGYR